MSMGHTADAGAMKRRIILCLRMAFLLLGLGGVVWFLLPLFKNGYNIGSVLGQGMCAALGFFALTLGKWKNRRMKMAVWVLLGFFVLAVGWFGFLTVQINTAQSKREIPPGTTVAVLGAKVGAYGPSASLKNRLDAALVRLKEDPTAPCIVTGGQGADEPRPEAHVAKDYLVEKGIAAERIFLEDTSVNTAQNMANSMDIAKREGIGTGLAIATQGFHQCRAALLAKDVGFTPYALVAETNPMLYPAYYGRELLSMTKYYLQKLL